MNNTERGRRTGQHEQPQQQATMFAACDREAVRMYYEAPAVRVDAAWPATSGQIAEACSMLAFADRIDIRFVEDWRDRDETRCDICGCVHTCDTCPECSSTDAARLARAKASVDEAAEDAAVEEL